MSEYALRAQNGLPVMFVQEERHIRLRQVFDLLCGHYGAAGGPRRARGLFALQTNLGDCVSDALDLVESAFDENTARLVWESDNPQLRVTSVWRLCEATGVCSRADTAQNLSKNPIELRRYLGRFVFSPGRYEAYSQSSRWCNENQGLWRPLDHGGIYLRCDGGRACQGGTPYLCLREQDSQRAVAFHILPRGNWTIRARAETGDINGPPFAVVDLGLDDQHLQLILQPGAAFAFPEILIQGVPGGEPRRAAPALHRYMSPRLPALEGAAAPVCYNTWFDTFDYLEVDRLRRQLAAAKEAGCDVFVIDAGWFGPGSVGWWQQVGDWREKQDAAFHGRMAAFAEDVRAAGLGFGLWMEPERFGPKAPVVAAQPEWFLPGEGDFFYIDLTKQPAYDYLLGEMARLIDTYALAWMKVDFNFELGHDPHAAEFSGYYDAWHRLMDTLRQQYPAVFFEGCASGGMRLDLSEILRCHGHFLSDTVDPIDVLRIGQGALLRLPPGRIFRWAVLRSADPVVKFAIPSDENFSAVVAPSGATWERFSATTVDFAARVALPGMFGISGDLAGLPNQHRERLRTHVEFYKEWRGFLADSYCHLLTPPRPKEDRDGWVAFQVLNPDDDRCLVFAYRLEAAPDQERFRLHDLDPNSQYRVAPMDGANETHTLSGAELTNDGLVVSLPTRNSAQVFIISPA